MALNDKARELIEAIKVTPEYAELKKIKTEISKNTDLRNKMQGFNKKQKEIYAARLSVKEMESELAELKKNFDDLSKIPEVNRFLKASNQFKEMLAKVFNSINDSIESELKF